MSMSCLPKARVGLSAMQDLLMLWEWQWNKPFRCVMVCLHVVQYVEFMEH